MFFGLIASIIFVLIPIGIVLLCLSPEPASQPNNTKSIGFWKRQFQLEPTRKQRVFDYLFGIILPVICFTFDPRVFNGNYPWLGNYKPFAYLLSFVSILALLAFMLWGKELKWLNGFLSGFFALGGTISLIVGIIIFPLSVVGLIILIGALGFTPLFTAFVYWRNATRSYQYAKPLLGEQVLIYSAVLSILFGFVTPFIVNVKIQRELKAIEIGDVQTIQEKTENLWIVSPILNPSNVWEASFHEEMYSPRKKALRESYKTLSGDDPAVWK